MADIRYLHPTTTQGIPAARVLEAASVCTEVLVLGWDAQGDFYAASTTSDGGTLLWWLEQFRHKLLSGAYG